ncbi:MAG TPA: ADOP family duplicated permease [Gemmatimonadaceae bacterium]
MKITPRVLRLRFGTRTAAAEMNEEIDAHIALCVDHLMARGVPRDEAEQQARARFGNLRAARAILADSAKHREGTMQRREWFGIIAQDLAFTIRRARREIALTAVIVAILGLGFGANAVMFGIVDRLLLSPPSNIPRPEDVVRPYFERNAKLFGLSRSYSTNWPGYRDLAGASSFASIGAYSRPRQVSIGRGSEASAATLAGATSTLFTVLGARPERGRFYSADEDRPPPGAPVAVVSHDYWTKHPDVLGRRIILHDVPFTVVGVAPQGFTGAELSPVDLWIPLTAFLNDDDGPSYVDQRGSYNIFTVARLKHGVPVARATAEASAIFAAHVDPRFTLRTPAPHVVLASVIPARGPDPHATATVALWLLGVAGVVLLVACANVATLLLTRAIRRTQEMAVRLSLGISAARLISQLLTESVFLTALGAVAAVIAARITQRAIYRLFLPQVAGDSQLLAPRWIGLLVALVLATAIVTSLAPAMYAASLDLSRSLRATNQTDTHRGRGLRQTLAVVQIALSVILLTGAGLFVRSLDNLRAVPLGLDLDRLVLAQVALPGDERAIAAHNAFWQEALRRVSSLGTVSGAALTNAVPFRSSMAMRFGVPGRDSLPHLPTGGPYANGVSPSYFSTAGTRIVQGRAFTAADGARAPHVLIVNETLAHMLWPTQTAKGRCVTILADSLPCATIVGVAEDVHRNGVIEPPQMQYYIPLEQWPDPTFGTPSMIVRGRSGDIERTASDVRRALQSIDPNAPYPLVNSFQSFIDPQLASWRLGARMFTLFGGLAFLVATIGLHGLLAYSVAQRRHEFGIRAALGASLDHLVNLVVLDGARLVAIGVVAGLAVSAIAVRWVAPLLFGVEPRDPAVYSAIIAGAALATVAAALVPARRAARTDPMTALRSE